MIKTYRCDFYLDDLACGGGHEVQSTDAERAAEEWLTEHDEHSLAADLVGLDFDGNHKSTVFVLDIENENVVWEIEVNITASVEHRAWATRAKKLEREAAEEWAPSAGGEG